MFHAISRLFLVAIVCGVIVPSSAEASAKRRTKHVYVVKKGDSLSSISRRLKVSVTELRWWNPTLVNARAMRPGRQLTYFVPTTIARGKAKVRRSKRGKSRTEPLRRAGSKTQKRANSSPRTKALTRKTSHPAPLPLRMPGEFNVPSTVKARTSRVAATAKPRATAARSSSSAANGPRTPAKSNKTKRVTKVRAQLQRAAVEKAPKIATRRRLKRTVKHSGSRSPASKVAPVAAIQTQTGRRGMAVLDWMGRASGRMPAKNPTPDMLPKKRSKALAEVVGSPNDGRLIRAQELPKQLPGIRSINRAKRFACDQTLEILAHVGRRLEERYPGTRPLLVGALSYEKGGRAGRHKSHQNGLDVDIAYFEKGNPKRRHYNGRVRWNQLDYDKNWFVFETMLLTGKLNYIFVDKDQLPHFRAAAVRSGWSKPALRRIFGDEQFRGPDRMIRHWKGHTYHAHVRFTCPRSDARCQHSRY